MKTLLLMCVLCSSAMGYKLEQGQKLPTSITWSCDDPILSDSFTRMFAIWNFACDGIFTLVPCHGSDFIQGQFFPVDIVTIYIVLDPTIDVRFLAWTYTPGDFAVIVVRDDMVKNLDVVMLHEIGHALGLDHTTDAHSIMHPDLKSFPSLNQDDVDGIREIYGLSPKQFDFQAVIKNHTVIVVSPYGKCRWVFDIWYYFDSKRGMRFRIGHDQSCEVEMIYRGISVYKTVEIKRK